MKRVVAALLPVADARAAGFPAGIRAVRPWAVTFFVAVAAAAAAASLGLAFGLPAATARTVAGGFLVLDATSRLFLLVVNLVFVGVATYLWTRVRDTPELQEGIERLVAFGLAFMAAANLAILSNHLVAMWVLLELSTLAAVPLVQHRGTGVRLRASWKYFLFSSVGLGLALLGLACVARGLEASSAHEATFFLGDLARAARTPPELWRKVGLVLIVLGYGTKLGLAPMYLWLPATYHASPPAVTVLLAGVQFNVALAALFRVIQVFGPSGRAVIAPELVALGLATMALSAASIVATRNYIRLIAYAALNHGGVIAIGLGIGAGYGVVLYAVSNAFIKAILFLTAGKIEAHYRTEDVREVSGLLKDMPYSGTFFAVGTFALLGFPPFGSFLGELIVMSGLIGSARFGVFAAFCTILTITFVATGRSVFPMIWGEPKRKVDWASQPVATVLPKLVFLCSLLAMGLYLPPQVNELFRQVAAGLGAE